MEDKFTILAVDDTQSDLQFILHFLGNEYNLIPALSGKNALAIANEKKIDLILLDIMMPEMDGYEVCILLKKNDATKDIPVIFITSRTDKDAIERAFDAGGIDYVIKPFRPKELLTRIQRELRLQQLARDQGVSKDPMTKFYNRTSLETISSHLIAQTQRELQDMSLLMIDIDNFKSISDTYGHEIGEKIIFALASTLQDMLRKGDVVCRYGNKEFVLLLTNTQIDGACALAEKIRQAIEEHILKTESGGQLNFTISIGATEVDVQTETQLEPAIKRAGAALYQARERGPNRLVIFHDSNEP